MNKSFRFSVVFFIMAAAAGAAEYVWDGGGANANWNNPTNWEGDAGYPGADPADIAIFSNPAPRMPTLNIGITVATVRVAGSSNWVVGGTALLEMSGGLEYDNTGTSSVAALMSGAGGVTVTAGVLTNSNTGSRYTGDVLIKGGALDVSAAAMSSNIASPAGSNWTAVLVGDPAAGLDAELRFSGNGNRDITVQEGAGVRRVRMTGGGSYTHTGRIILSNDTVFVPRSGYTYGLNGTITGTGFVVVAGVGKVSIGGTANDYGGKTIINEGQLEVATLVATNNSRLGSPAAGNEEVLLGDTSGSANATLHPVNNGSWYRPVRVRAGSSGLAIMDFLGNGQTWTFYDPIVIEKDLWISQVQNGSFTLRNTLTMAGGGTPALTLLLLATSSHRGAINLYSGTQPDHTGGTRLTGQGIFEGNYGSFVWYYPGTPGEILPWRMGNAPGGGPGTITLDGAAFSFYPQLPSGTATYSNDNVIVVTTNSGVLNWQISGGSNHTNIFAGPILLGGVLDIGDRYISASSLGRYTGTITLDHSVAGRRGLAASRYACTALYVDGNIVDGPGSTRNSLMLFATTSDTYPPFLTGSGSTYAGGTVVEGHQTGLYEVRTESGSLGLGSFWLMEGGRIRFNDAWQINTAGGATVSLYGNDSALSVLALAGNFCPTLASDSAGVLAVDTNGYTAVTSLAALGKRVYLGSVRGGSFTGASLAPAADGVYRLGGGGGTLAISNGVLAGAGSSVQVGDSCGGNSLVGGGATMANGSGTVRLMAANSYGGGTVVNANSVLRGQAQLSGTPFGSETAGVTLNAGTLWVDGTNASVKTAVGQVTVNGLATLNMSQAGGTTNILAVDSFSARSNAAPWVALFQGSAANSLGGKERIVVTNGAPAPVNNMVAPFHLSAYGTSYGGLPDFLTYNDGSDDAGVIGFTNASAYYVAVTDAAGLQAPHASDIVHVTSTLSMTGDASVYALRVNNVNINNTGGKKKISIGSGGLITLGGTITNDVAFGAEAVVVAGGANADATISGNLSGTNGLTKAGGRKLTLTGNNSGLTGTIAVVQGNLAPAYDLALGAPENSIYLDGGTLTFPAGTWYVNRAVRLGPAGGYLDNGGVNNLMVWGGAITGPGTLSKLGTGQGRLALTSPNNTYAGGTILGTRELSVSNTSTLGVGDVTITTGVEGPLRIFGDRAIGGGDVYGNNTTSRHARLSIYGRGYVYFVCPEPTLGSLSGSGMIYLSNTVLRVGYDNSSTIYSGYIWRSPSTSVGSVRKVGSGTFTFKGQNVCTGGLFVDGGALMLDGYNAGAIAVSNGAALGGSGAVGSNLTMAAGAVYRVTLNGTNDYTRLTFAGPTVSLGGATLTIMTGPNYAPAGSDVFHILLKSSAGAIADTFGGLPDGSRITLDNGWKCKIAYNVDSGDGTANDVKLYEFTRGGGGAFILIR